MNDEAQTPLRAKVYDLLEMGQFGNRRGRIVDRFLVLLILISVAAVMLETVAPLASRFRSELRFIEWVVLAIFTVEYGLRLWVSVERVPEGYEPAWKTRLKYAASPLAIIDLLAIIPGFLFLTGQGWLVLRVFRLMRIFKLVRYSPGMVTLNRVLYEERRSLAAVLVIMAGLLLVAATAMFLAEGKVQPESLGSIPAALWWALATFTTVGYGDVVPVSLAGKVVGGFVMVIGFAFYAVPIGIIASGFANEIHRQQFVVRFGLVSKVPLFKGLPPEALSDIAQMLRSSIVDTGKVITYRGNAANSFYFLLQGRAEVRLGKRRIPLHEGEFFGEPALLGEGRSRATVVAKSVCRLLELSVPDFQRILVHYPELDDRVDELVENRLSRLLNEGEISEAEKAEIKAAHNDMLK